MKLRYLWKITLDNERKQGIRSFFNVILYIVGITIIGLLVYFVSLETDTKKSVERSIRKEIKTLGSISIEGNPSDIQYNSNFNLLKVVKSFSGIDASYSIRQSPDIASEPFPHPDEHASMPLKLLTTFKRYTKKECL